MIRRFASLLFLISVASAANKPNIILVMTDGVTTKAHDSAEHLSV
ncbi:hypothetical protein N9A78_02120 [Akkermansiaceae bacterium]|jgi:hypothetical protein|nr:hypothetical protein [Akkermansiaceae bacterium]